jgi:carbon monoxide dehydrogenase subunit G
MSILIYFFLGLITFVIIVAIIGYMSPSTVHLEVSKKINAAPDVIFQEVGDFENFVTWSPWSAKDPNMKQQFEGEKLSVGSKYSWSGNKQVGKGSLEIVHIEANRVVVYDMMFGQGKNITKCTFKLEPTNGETNVSWIMDADMGNNPFSRFMGRMMAKFVTKDFNEGLNNLSNKLVQK